MTFYLRARAYALGLPIHLDSCKEGYFLFWALERDLQLSSFNKLSIYLLASTVPVSVYRGYTDALPGDYW